MRWSVLILLGIFFVSFASAAIPADCDPSMISYWQFEDDSGDSVGIYDGTGLDGYSSFIVGKGADLDGDKSMNVSDNNVMFAGSFSVEMWISKLDFFPDVNATLLEMGGYKIVFTEEDKVVASIDDNATVSSGVLADNANHHVALVWDGNSAGDNLKLYINGGEVDQTSWNVTVGTGSRGLIIGSGFVGKIDELAIYSDDLSALAVKYHYDLTSDSKDYCDASGTGGASSTESNFTLDGCHFDLGGGIGVDVSRKQCSRGDFDGKFYCDSYKDGWVTADEGLGCAMGNPGFAPGDDFCCPVGSFCEETAPEVFKCTVREINCVNLSRPSCLDNGCIWFDDKCLDGKRDYGCWYYDKESTGTTDEDACEVDEFNFGKEGIGTDMCGETIQCDGKTYSVPVDKCVCKWYDNAEPGKKCQVKMIATQMFFPVGSTPNSFSCSSSYEVNDCIEGKQLVNWTSNVSEVIGFDVAIPAEKAIVKACSDALGCHSGDDERNCGEPLIKLPGFSLFALFASLFIVGMYYFLRGDNE